MPRAGMFTRLASGGATRIVCRDRPKGDLVKLRRSVSILVASTLVLGFLGGVQSPAAVAGPTACGAQTLAPSIPGALDKMTQDLGEATNKYKKGKISKRSLKRRLKAIIKQKEAIIDSLPFIFGINMLQMYLLLESLDIQYLDARTGDPAAEMSRAFDKLSALDGMIPGPCSTNPTPTQCNPDQSTPLIVQSNLSGLFSATSMFVTDHIAGMTKAQQKTRAQELADMKIGWLLGFHNILDIAFQDLFGELEDLDFDLEDAKDARTKAETLNHLEDAQSHLDFLTTELESTPCQ